MLAREKEEVNFICLRKLLIKLNTHKNGRRDLELAHIVTPQLRSAYYGTRVLALDTGSTLSKRAAATDHACVTGT